MSEHSLVVQTAFLGDVVLTTPLVALLATRGPVDVVVRPDAAALLANNPDVRRVFVYDKRGEHAGARGVWRVAAQLRAVARDDARGGAVGRRTAYLAQGSIRSAMLASLGGYGERVGFETSRQARPLYTRTIAYRPEHHHAERLLSLGLDGPLRATSAELRPRLYPGTDERAAVTALLVGAGAAGAPLVALAPGSVWATKRWPYYAELAAQLSVQLGEAGRIVVTGGAGDSPLASAIVAACAPGRVIDATGRLSLLASAELLSRCAALVTNDSAPQHLASAMGVPTITVFGPTVPAFGFGPLAPRSVTLGHASLACRPCDQHGPQRCPLTHWRCMREVGADAVAEAVRAALRLGTLGADTSFPT